jgi:hypothetical protein
VTLVATLALALTAAGCASATAGPQNPSAPHNPSGPQHASPPHPARSRGRAALMAHLAILRRPAAKTDTEPALEAQLRQMAHEGCASLFADPSLTRLATITRDGTRVYVVVFRPSSCWPECSGTARTCMRHLPRQAMVAVIPVTSGQNYRQFATLRELEAGLARSGDQSAGFVLVPDGVTRVVRRVITPNGRPYQLARKVRNNLAIFPHQAQGTMIWLNAAGRVIGPARLRF